MRFPDMDTIERAARRKLIDEALEELITQCDGVETVARLTCIMARAARCFSEAIGARATARLLRHLADEIEKGGVN